MVLSEDATVAGICDGVAVPGAADTDAGCTSVWQGLSALQSPELNQLLAAAKHLYKP